MAPVNASLLEALHGGMFEQPLWGSFLERLRVQSGATYVTLVFRPIDEESAIELQAGPPLPDLHRGFIETYDPKFASYRHMRVDRVYSFDELIDPNEPQLAAYRRDTLEPLGITALRSVRVTEPSGVDAWLSCSGGRKIGAAVGGLLTALVPHLRIALRTYVALERERFRSRVTTEAFSRMNFGWLTLDARCRITDCAPHLEQMLQRSSVLRRGRYDRLTPVEPSVDRELTALVRRFADKSETRPRAFNLSRDPWTDMLVTPAMQHSVTSSATPVAIAYLSGDRRSQADRCEQLVDLFGLLPSEARLAWAIAQGLSIAEAAQELGLTLETARHYSKKIYAKTGARGQTELVRNILTSVLAFA
jgi:DNA-binding CsgD family transcriptional regulator